MTNVLQSGSVAVLPPRDYHDHLADAGSYASIVGLLISFWVLISLRRIRNQFLFQARYPTLKKAISGHSDALSKHLNVFPDSLEELESEFQPCLANLKNLKGKLSGATKKSVHRVIVMIAEIPKPLSENCKQDVRNVYNALVGLEAELKNLSEDQKWRSD